MSWNYRIVWQTVDGEPIYGLHEVFYDADGKPSSWSVEPVLPAADSEEGIRFDYEMMRLAFFRSALRETGKEGEMSLEPEAGIEANWDSYLRHEALDRVAVFASQFSGLVDGHPLIEGVPDYRKLTEEISDKLGELYQMIGREERGGRSKERSGSP